MPQRKHRSLRLVDERGERESSMELRKLNAMRDSLGLKPLSYRKQDCLVCEELYTAQFIGEKKVNRMCTRCSKIDFGF